MHRYLMRAHIEPSPEVLSALAAASLTVHEASGDGDLANVTVKIDPAREGTLDQLLDVLSPPPDAHGVTVALNASSEVEAVATVREALERWGEIAVEVVARRVAVALAR